MQVAVTKQVNGLDVIKGAIAAKIDSASFSSWIAPLDFEISDNTLTLVAQNQFSADYILSVYENILSSVANEYGLSLNICVRGTRTSVANDNTQKSYSPTPVVTNTHAFDSFITSDDNTFVLSACKKVASGPVSFSPLFIYGASGCGKTLLANCIRDASGAKE